MPEQKRPRSTSRSTSSKSTAKGRTGGTAASKAKKTTQKRSTGGRSTTGRSTTGRSTTGRSTTGSTRKPASSRPAKPRNEELEPLDLEGTDFEELLGAGEPETAVSDTEPEDIDEESLDDDDTEDADLYASLRPSARLGGIGSFSADVPDEDAAEDTPPLAAPDAEGVATPAPWAPSPDPVSPAVGGDDDDESHSIEELGVGLLGLALMAVSFLLPWYQLGDRTLTPLAAGDLAVLPFVAGAAAVVTVALRRAKIPVKFPFQTGVVLEGLGYLAVAGAIFKPLLLKETTYELVRRNQIISIVIGIALSFLAARLSTGAPLVHRPGWFKERGGKAGAGILAGTLAVGVLLAVLKPGASDLSASPTGTSTSWSKQPPACFTEVKFPVLDVLDFPVVENRGSFFVQRLPGGNAVTCGATFTAEAPVSEVRKRFMNALRNNGWEAEVAGTATRAAVSISLLEPRCGSVHLFAAGEGLTGTINFADCAAIGGVPPQG